MRIDSQSHIWPPPFVDYLLTRSAEPRAFRAGGETFIDTGPWRRKAMPGHSDMAAKVRAMDRCGIDLTVLTPNDPGPERFGAEGPVVARLLNNFVAEQARAYPGRFAGLAVLPLQDERAAREELDRCVYELRLRGVLLYSNLNGQFPDEPEFAWLFARSEELGFPLYLHPACPVTYEQTSGRNLVGALGLMFDTTIALARIILSGLLDRHPGLTLVCPHVGGALPYLIGRLDHQTMVLKRGAEHLTRAPSEYLRNVWFDTVSPWAAALRYGLEMVGPDRLLFASDHPWVEPDLIIPLVEGLNLPPADTEKVFNGNARRLFNLP
ncbi:MAG: amidohydrolase [Actinobacteria bacterium]|nr:amidohydrolase [Actinomycetota bacterium]